MQARATTPSPPVGDDNEFREKPLTLAGVAIDNLTREEAVLRLVRAAQAGHRRVAHFVNANNLNIAWQHRRYRDILADSDLVLGDGIGLKLAARLTGRTIRDNVNGTDLFPELWRACADRCLRVFLLGGQSGVAFRAGSRMDWDFNTGVMASAADGFFPEAQAGRVIETINATGADLLLVGMGTPVQELWIERYQDQLDVPVIIGVGGLFDFYSSRIPRAPKSWRRLGMEWVWRLYQEPQRMWRRYLIGNPLFLSRALVAGSKEF